jgi:hypothetical protein
MALVEEVVLLMLLMLVVMEEAIQLETQVVEALEEAEVEELLL